MRRRTVQPEIPIVCFGASIPCHAIGQKQNEEWELFQRVQRFWQRKVWTQCLSGGEKLRCKFLARKSAKSFVNTKMQICGKESAKLSANFSASEVTSLPSLSLSLSLSLSPSAPHAQHRKRLCASFNYSYEVHSGVSKLCRSRTQDLYFSLFMANQK